MTRKRATLLQTDACGYLVVDALPVDAVIGGTQRSAEIHAHGSRTENGTDCVWPISAAATPTTPESVPIGLQTSVGTF